MARDRIALILESMAANKELKSSHYKIYLCIFSGLQEGVLHTVESIAKITGMHIRTAQKGVNEMLETGRIVRDENDLILTTFYSGFPSKVQKIEPVQKGESAANQGEIPEKHSKTQSVLYQDTKNKKYEIEDIDHKTSNEKHLNVKQDLRSSVPRNEELKGPDPRFKILVDTLFLVYEKDIGEKLNPLWTIADASMIKRLLKSLPDETPYRIAKSFHSFLQTNDSFDADHVRESGVVRFWASKVTKYLPEKDIDIKEIYAKMTGEKEVL